MPHVAPRGIFQVFTPAEHVPGGGRRRVAALGIDCRNAKLALKNAGTHRLWWVPALLISTECSHRWDAATNNQRLSVAGLHRRVSHPLLGAIRRRLICPQVTGARQFRKRSGSLLLNLQLRLLPARTGSTRRLITRGRWLHRQQRPGVLCATPTRVLLLLAIGCVATLLPQPQR